MKKTYLVSATLFATLLAFGGTAFADAPACGEAQDDSWMQPEAIQEKIETLGYTIENLGISEGNCYELTGLNVQGQSVTAYFDPKTGDVVQEDVAQ